MAQSVYITSAEGHSGKSTVALGVLDALSRTTERVGVFRAIARSTDEPDFIVEALLARTNIDLSYDECIGATYDEVRTDPVGALATIVQRFKRVEAKCNAVVVVGSDYTDVGAPAELGYNARIAVNLSTPVLLVLSGRDPHSLSQGLGASEARTPAELAKLAALARTEIVAQRAEFAGAIINRADPDETSSITEAVRQVFPEVPVWSVPEEPILVAPSIGDIMQAVDGELAAGDDALLAREALGVVVAAMSMEHVLSRLTDGACVIIPGDRTEVLVGVLLANASATFPSVAGIVLNGPFDVPDTVRQLLAGVGSRVPIIRTGGDTYATAVRVMSARGSQSASSPQRLVQALSLFERHVDTDELTTALGIARSGIVTPLMFEYGLLERARSVPKRIVLPEGDDDRVLQAAGILLKREVAQLIILGEPFDVRARALELGVDITGAEVLSPFDAPHVEKFAREYAALREHKGMTVERAADTVTDVSYFGTMMVHMGLADGMVSGAAHTTAHTIRPAFEIIKTKPDVSVVSSVFFMALADRVLVYGDCAVVPDPTAEQLADIAVSSARTAAQFDIDPRVAMLSYSTGESGSGEDVEKVREATALAKQQAPDLPLEGPIQYDAASDAAVARAKLPESAVAGRATVFIFPDLNTGNNTYKAVQRSAGAVAIGPVLQGLNKPINDLSRGALVSDIVNTVAITAIQAAGG